jgi:hypothetical protein
VDQVLVPENFNVLSGIAGVKWTILGMMQEESGFDPHKRSTKESLPGTGTLTSKYVHSPEVAPLYAPGSSTRDPVSQGFFAWGVMQVMGWHHIRWTKGGELQGHPLAAKYGLVYPAGSDIQSLLYSGNNAALNGMVSGMIILEKYYLRELHIYKNPKDALAAAVKSYLGNGAKDANNTTPGAYLESVYANARSLSAGKVPKFAHTGSGYVASAASPPTTPPMGCS